MSLLTDLIAHWPLDEASGAAIDAHGSNDLTETSGTIAAATGKIGGARDFEAGDTEYFEIADNADLSTGDIDFTFAAWVYIETNTADNAIAGKGNAAGQLEWLIRMSGSGGAPRLQISTNGTSYSHTALWGSNLSAGQWYFIVAWHDAAANQIGISVDNGTPVTTATTGNAPSDRTGAFRLGHDLNAFYWDGLIDSVSFWKRVLTSDERAYLYNSGFGLPYEYFGVTADPSALLDDLEAYWPLDEASGDALDAHGSLDLTETGGTIAADTGKVSGCRDFEAADTEHFEIADSAALSGGDTDFTIAGWVKFESTGTQILLGKLKTTGDQREYGLLLQTSQLRFQVFPSGTTSGSTTVTASNFGNVVADVWYFVVVKHDSAGDIISIQVNLGTPNTAAHSTGVFDGTAKFTLGNTESGIDAGNLYFDGMLDEWGFWRRLLTDAELVALYNEGDGLDYGSFEGSGGVVLTGRYLSLLGVGI